MKKNRKPETPIPPDFTISPAVRDWAKLKGYSNLEAHLESFRDKVAAHDYRYCDWDAAFRNCIRKDWGRVNGQPKNGFESPKISTAAHKLFADLEPRR